MRRLLVLMAVVAADDGLRARVNRMDEAEVVHRLKAIDAERALLDSERALLAARLRRFLESVEAPEAAPPPPAAEPACASDPPAAMTPPMTMPTIETPEFDVGFKYK